MIFIVVSLKRSFFEKFSGVVFQLIFREYFNLTFRSLIIPDYIIISILPLIQRNILRAFLNHKRLLKSIPDQFSDIVLFFSFGYEPLNLNLVITAFDSHLDLLILEAFLIQLLFFLIIMFEIASIFQIDDINQNHGEHNAYSDDC